LQIVIGLQPDHNFAVVEGIYILTANCSKRYYKSNVQKITATLPTNDRHDGALPNGAI